MASSADCKACCKSCVSDSVVAFLTENLSRSLVALALALLSSSSSLSHFLRPKPPAIATSVRQRWVLCSLHHHSRHRHLGSLPSSWTPVLPSGSGPPTRLVSRTRDGETVGLGRLAFAIATSRIFDRVGLFSGTTSRRLVGLVPRHWNVWLRQQWQTLYLKLSQLMQDSNHRLTSTRDHGKTINIGKCLAAVLENVNAKPSRAVHQ
jgi:hypothetical protein